MTKNKISPTKQVVFYYKGDGLCIPGLPHAVTRAQAEALGLSDTLEAAIRSGVYQSQGPPVSAETPERSMSAPRGADTADGGSKPPRLEEA